MSWRLIPLAWAIALAAYPMIIQHDFGSIVFNTGIILLATAGNGAKNFRHYAAAGILLLLEYGVLTMNSKGIAAGLTGVFSGLAVFLLLEMAYIACLLPEEQADSRKNSSGQEGALELQVAARSLLRRSALATAVSICFLAGFLILTQRSALPAQVLFLLLMGSSLILAALIAWTLFTGNRLNSSSSKKLHE